MALLRPMQIQDLDAVMALEVVCFPTPWSRDLYVREIVANNSVANSNVANSTGTYWVLVPGPDETELPPLLAYGGIWLIADEAHVTTLASHPAWRRHGYAGRVLVHLLEVARARGATLATLEARASNVAAIRLYEKLGFVAVGVRRGYYSDTREDARLLTLFDLDSPAAGAQLAARRREFEALAT